MGTLIKYFGIMFAAVAMIVVIIILTNGGV